jgi:membrane-bound lytic murein transglycosylase D
MFTGCVARQSIQTVETPDPVSEAIIHYNKALGTDSIPLAREEIDSSLALLLSVNKNQYIDSLITEICLTRTKLERKRVANWHLRNILEGDFLYTKDVDRWINYYVSDGRNYMNKALMRSQRYIKTIKDILKEEGVPSELAWLPIIESGFHPYARSSVGACGLWQFMPGTAKLYGLKIDDFIDERRNIYKSTRAAAHYLKNLHSMYSNWNLALAAYNWGGRNVNSSITRCATNDFQELILPRETANFIPKFYAALLIALDPQVYGFPDYDDTERIDTVIIQGSMELKRIAALSGVDINLLKDLNPEIRDIITPPTGWLLKLPYGKRDEFVERLNNIPEDERYLSKKEIKKYR